MAKLLWIKPNFKLHPKLESIFEGQKHFDFLALFLLLFLSHIHLHHVQSKVTWFTSVELLWTCTDINNSRIWPCISLLSPSAHPFVLHWLPLCLFKKSHHCWGSNFLFCWYYNLQQPSCISLPHQVFSSFQLSTEIPISYLISLPFCYYILLLTL